MFLRLSVFMSIKLANFYRLCFQRDAARPQGGAADFVHMILGFLQRCEFHANFAGVLRCKLQELFFVRGNSLCKSCVNPLLMRGKKKITGRSTTVFFTTEAQRHGERLKKEQVMNTLIPGSVLC